MTATTDAPQGKPSSIADPTAHGRLSGDALARMTEDEMLELAERWRPYRSLAVSYLFASEFDRAS